MRSIVALIGLTVSLWAGAAYAQLAPPTILSARESGVVAYACLPRDARPKVCHIQIEVPLVDNIDSVCLVNIVTGDIITACVPVEPGEVVQFDVLYKNLAEGHLIFAAVALDTQLNVSVSTQVGIIVDISIPRFFKVIVCPIAPNSPVCPPRGNDIEPAF